MTDLAVPADGSTVLTDVFTIVAAETTRIDPVPDVVRVFLPIDFHLREEVVVIDIDNNIDGILDLGGHDIHKAGIFNLIEIPHLCTDQLGRLLVRGILSYERLNAESFNIGKRRVDSLLDQGLVHGQVRRLIDVSRPVVTDNAIYKAFLVTVTAFPFMLGILLVTFGPILHHCSVRVLFPYDRDHLLFGIGSLEGDLFVGQHVPVDT